MTLQTVRRLTAGALAITFGCLPIGPLAPRAAYAITIIGGGSIPGNGDLEPDEELDFQIVNIVPGEPANELIFSDSDPDGLNPSGTTHVNCRQYVRIVFRSNRLDARLTLYTDNTASNASPRFTGSRTKDDPSFDATVEEETYDTEEPAGERHNLEDGKKPQTVSGGLVGIAEPKEVAPVVWQIHDELPAVLPDYDFEDPIHQDPSRPLPLSNPTDLWGFIVERFALDFHFAIDLATGHFKVDAVNGDPENHNWLPTVGYRTLAVPTFAGNELLIGGFPGNRDADGFRVDQDGIPIEYGADGLPVDPTEAAAAKSADEDIYLFLGANFLGKHAQDFSSNKLILEYSFINGTTGLTERVLHEIPMRATFEAGKELGVTIKAKVAGETTSALVFSNTNPNGTNPAGTRAVNSRQYLEVTASTNVLDGRFVMYADNSVPDANPRLTAARDQARATFDATPDEQAYVHALADGSGRRSFIDGRKPIPVTGGLVGVSNPSVAVPIVWQVYDDEDVDPDTPGVQFPDYDFDDPLSQQATDQWAFLMERFSWDFDFAVDFATGHFKIDPADGDPDNHFWLPTAGYRTLMDSFSNLGGFPGPRDASGDRIPNLLEQGTSPIYVYLGANYAGKPAQSYQTNKIVVEFIG